MQPRGANHEAAGATALSMFTISVYAQAETGSAVE